MPAFRARDVLHAQLWALAPLLGIGGLHGCTGPLEVIALTELVRPAGGLVVGL
jgi:hypothetical protein